MLTTLLNKLSGQSSDTLPMTIRKNARRWFELCNTMLETLIKYINDKESRQQLKFLRNAAEIWDTDATVGESYKIAQQHLPVTKKLVSNRDLEGLIEYATEQAKKNPPTLYPSMDYASYHLLVMNTFMQLNEDQKNECWGVCDRITISLDTNNPPDSQ